jgi:hypothetical protein
MYRVVTASKKTQKKRICASVMGYSEAGEDLGIEKELNYKVLLAGVESIDIKDTEPYEGKKLYTLKRDTVRVVDEDGEPVRTEHLYLVPLDVERFIYYPAETGMWPRSEQYALECKISGTSHSLRYSTEFIGSRGPFFNEENANKIRENAKAINDEIAYVDQRDTGIDSEEIKNAFSTVRNDSKILESSIFSNGEVDVRVGASYNKELLTAYLRLVPTDGPFMSSTLYEVYYKPMKDGVVYRSYGAFGSASSKKDWYKNASNNVKEITINDMYDDLAYLQNQYDSLTDNFDYRELSKQIAARFK